MHISKLASYSTERAAVRMVCRKRTPEEERAHLEAIGPIIKEPNQADLVVVSDVVCRLILSKIKKGNSKAKACHMCRRTVKTFDAACKRMGVKV
jgi:hypothetical protein